MSIILKEVILNILILHFIYEAKNMVQGFQNVRICKFLRFILKIKS